MNQNRSKNAANARGRKLNKSFLVLLSLVLLVSIAGGATLAYLTSKPEAVNNSFVAGKVECVVNEANGKVTVTNNGNVDAYVRITVVATWQDGNGNVIDAPSEQINVNKTSAWNDSGSVAEYYYYPQILAPGETTAAFTTGFTFAGSASDIPEGYTLKVDVLAQAVQAKGTKDDGGAQSYMDAWANPAG